MATTTDIRRLKRIVSLTYLQTVAVLSGDQSKQNFVGSPQPFNQSKTSVSQPSTVFNLFGGLMGSSGGSQALDFQDTGWTISSSWLETYWDKIRYSIGIRDIGIHQFSYAAISEVISKPWNSPKDIEKVTLVVDEVIPQEFPIGPSYIEYYISAAPGTTWIRLNPIDNPTVFGDNGAIVPRIINFNAEKPANATNDNAYFNTDQEIKSVRFRAVLKRPTGIQGADAMTPTLKGYRLLIYPRGGLA